MVGWRTAAVGALLGCGVGAAWASPEEAVPLEAVAVPAEAALSRSSWPSGSAVVHLRAARGEREPVVIAVRSARERLVTAHVSAFFNHAGGALPAQVVELDRIDDVDAGDHQLPDRLEPWSNPQRIAPEANLLLWLEVAVPRLAAAGYYHGELQLSTGSASRTLPIELEVLPFSLPQKPSLATSFGTGRQSGPVTALARAGLQERVTLRVFGPPAFHIDPASGALQLDFSTFDRELAALLDPAGSAGLSSLEVPLPAELPRARRIEFLLAVKRHLAERGCEDLLVSFNERAPLVQRAGNEAPISEVALVAANEPGTPGQPFWWNLDGRLGSGAMGTPCCTDETARALEPGASGARVRAIGWSAFHAGARGLYSPDALPLLYESDDGAPRLSVRLKLLRQGLEDYEYLALASKIDPPRVSRLVAGVLGAERHASGEMVDFDGVRDELIRLIRVRRPHAMSQLP